MQIIYRFPYSFKYIKNLCYIDTFLHVEAQAVCCIGSLSRKEGRLSYAGKEGWLLGLEVISILRQSRRFYDCWPLKGA
jgi:hypothetical protein